jgi:hypothetical protein
MYPVEESLTVSVANYFQDFSVKNNSAKSSAAEEKKMCS